MDAALAIDALLHAIPALAQVCRDPDVEQLRITPSGRWIVHKLGQPRNQPEPLTMGPLEPLRDALRGDTPVVWAQGGWRFWIIEGAPGPTLFGERLPLVRDDVAHPEALRVLRAQIELGHGGLVLGPPGSGKMELLCWIARQFPQDTITLVSAKPPARALGARICHAFPPQRPEQAQALRRLLRHSEVTLWDNPEGVDDARDALGYPGARRRWIALDSASLIAGLNAFHHLAPMRRAQSLHTIALTASSGQHGGGLAALFIRTERGWQEALGAQGDASWIEPLLSRGAPPEAAERIPAPPLAAPRPSPDRTTAELRPLEAPGREPLPQDTHPHQLAASAIHEIFEDSDVEELRPLIEATTSPSQPALTAALIEVTAGLHDDPYEIEAPDDDDALLMLSLAPLEDADEAPTTALPALSQPDLGFADEDEDDQDMLTQEIPMPTSEELSSGAFTLEEIPGTLAPTARQARLDEASLQARFPELCFEATPHPEAPTPAHHAPLMGHVDATAAMRLSDDDALYYHTVPDLEPVGEDTTQALRLPARDARARKLGVEALASVDEDTRERARPAPLSAAPDADKLGWDEHEQTNQRAQGLPQATSSAISLSSLSERLKALRLQRQERDAPDEAPTPREADASREARVLAALRQRRRGEGD